MNDETREAARQWRAKAQSDRTAVEILVANKRCPPDTVCFHCQQSVEKLLKALLTLHGVEVPKTHDLRRLIQLAEPFAPELVRLSDSADALTPYGVQIRYPEDPREIDSAEMNKAVELAGRFAEVLDPKLDV